MNFVTVCGPADDGISGLALGVCAILLAGLPAAAVALGLALEHRSHRNAWSGWSAWFQFGFILQGSSLVLATLGLLLTALSGPQSLDEWGIVGFLALNLAVGPPALIAWRQLQFSTPLTAATSLKLRQTDFC